MALLVGEGLQGRDQVDRLVGKAVRRGGEQLEGLGVGAATGSAASALEVAGATTRETGYAFMRDILAAGPPAFTGVFAHNDRAAAGAIQAIREAGLRVPEDISIVGFDNAAFSADLQLTTVHIPAVELGQAAVSLAVNPDDPQQQVMLGTHVVVRESVRVFSPVSAR